MKTYHPVVKFLTGTLFIVLMLAFVAFRSGAFDSPRSAQIKLHVSRTGKSHHQKSKNDMELTLREKPQANDNMSEHSMMASSKSIVTSPVNWSLIGSPEYLISSSKSITVSTASSGSVYGGIFSTPNRWKAKSKGEQLKQGKSK